MLHNLRTGAWFDAHEPSGASSSGRCARPPSSPARLSAQDAAPANTGPNSGTTTQTTGPASPADAAAKWRYHRHRAEAQPEPAGRADQHPGTRHAEAAGPQRQQFRRLREAAALGRVPVDRRHAGHQCRLHAWRGVGRGRQSFGLAAVGRRVSGRAAGHHDRRQSRRTYLRHRPDREPRRAAGHAVRRLVGSGHHPDHHQQARPHRHLRPGRPGAQHHRARPGPAARPRDSSTLPLSPAMALRVVGWYERDGGFIDNVPGQRCFLPQPGGICVDNGVFREEQLQRRRDRRVGAPRCRSISTTTGPSRRESSTRTPRATAPAPTIRSVGDLQIQHFYPEYRHDHFVQAVAHHRRASWATGTSSRRPPTSIGRTSSRATTPITRKPTTTSIPRSAGSRDTSIISG